MGNTTSTRLDIIITLIISCKLVDKKTKMAIRLVIKKRGKKFAAGLLGGLHR
jgi:hypothetical protein